MVVGRGDEALALTKRLKDTDPFFAPPWEIEARIEAARGDYVAADDSIRTRIQFCSYDSLVDRMGFPAANPRNL
jgi:hypothetical protein